MIPVDVLAYLDARIASHKALSADAYHAQEVPKAEAVRAAVAELIEADKECDAAVERFDTAALGHARNRRAAALARVGAAS